MHFLDTLLHRFLPLLCQFVDFLFAFVEQVFGGLVNGPLVVHYIGCDEVVVNLLGKLQLRVQ